MHIYLKINFIYYGFYLYDYKISKFTLIYPFMTNDRIRQNLGQ